MGWSDSETATGPVTFGVCQDTTTHSHSFSILSALFLKTAIMIMMIHHRTVVKEFG